MSISASLTLKINKTNIYNIIECYLKNGWRLTDKTNKITYLPIGDKDNYSWVSNYITEIDYTFLFKKKLEIDEVIGIQLYKGEIYSTILLFLPSNEVIINCDIYRKTLDLAKNIEVTDINWYINEFVVPLRKEGYYFESLEYQEIY